MKKLTTITLTMFIGLGTLASSAFAEEKIVKVVTDYNSMRMYFDPSHIIIKPGDTVTWVNQSDEDHNMVTYPDGFPKNGKGFKSPYLAKEGEKWSHKFDVEGTYDYHCIPHVFMGMHGEVVVGKASAPDERHTPTAVEVTEYRDEMLKFFDRKEFEHAPEYVRLKKKALMKDSE